MRNKTYTVINDWNKTLVVFEILVKSIVIYGVEIWGWKEYEYEEYIVRRKPNVKS